MKCIQFILHPGQAISELCYILPIGELDEAQSILLYSMEVVPWCWGKWDDCRQANVETLILLVSTHTALPILI
jgi:hypothetical protein